MRCGAVLGFLGGVIWSCAVLGFLGELCVFWSFGGGVLVLGFMRLLVCQLCFGGVAVLGSG